MKKFTAYNNIPLKTRNDINLIASFDSPEEKANFFGSIINRIGDELILLNSEGRIVYANEAAVKGLGLVRSDLLGRKITEFFAQRISIQEWKKKHYELLKREGRPVPFKVERIVGGGKHQTIEVTAGYLSYQGDGYILSVARDITDHLRTEYRLRASERLYRLLAEDAGDPIFMLDAAGRFTYANHRAVDFLQISFSNISKQRFFDFVHPESRKKAISTFRHLKNEPRRVQIELDGINKKGEKIPIEVTASPIMKDDQLNSIHLIVRDLRQRRQLDELMRQSEKMKTMQKFVAGAAQELTHPLLATLNRIQWLIDKYKSRDFEYIGYREFSDMIQALESINAQIKYCHDTTTRLVGLDRKKGENEKRKSDVNHCIQDIIRLKKYQMELAGITCKSRLAPYLPSALLDEIESKQIINNVIDNAIQSMPAGGNIFIRTSYQPALKIVLIEIMDEGIGISKEHLSQVFDPFFTIKQRGPQRNSGLGLTIVYSLIKAVQGDIQIESSLRKGTRVKISLPAVFKKFRRSK